MHNKIQLEHLTIFYFLVKATNFFKKKYFKGVWDSQLFPHAP